MDSGTKQKKKNATDQPVSEDIVPLHIQTFLWRQTSSFLRPKIGKMHEASCIVSNIVSTKLLFFYNDRNVSRQLRC
ncbi:Unc-80 protein [Daphnia magna]|uniref:Unc-80 protein n=1 Tax=Daphnia magna TaxID=35525 RepID=A0A164WF78_9CRUS|nr:Unc-80 protein [Daphnia magna]